VDPGWHTENVLSSVIPSVGEESRSLCNPIDYNRREIPHFGRNDKTKLVVVAQFFIYPPLAAPDATNVKALHLNAFNGRLLSLPKRN
jgi:hypothetical protein